MRHRAICSLRAEMKQLFSFGMTLVLGFALVACATGTVRTSYDFDRFTNFEVFNTYAWIGNDKLYIADNLRGRTSPLLAERLASIVDAELATKGLRMVDSAESADIVVGMTVGARDRIRVDAYPTSSLYYGRYYSRYGSAYWGTGPRMQTTQYVEGTLSIDLFDAQLSKPVWHGQGTRNFSVSSVPLTDDQLRAAVSEILLGYPPQ